MDALLLYYFLLALWIPLLWPALRLHGWKRGALLVVIFAGALATASEVWQSFGQANAIRIDILVLTVVLVMLYAAAAAVLLLARWRVSGILLAVALVLIGGSMGYGWMTIMQESQRLTEKFNERNRLLFDARFRDPKTYEAYFGPFTAPAGRYPVGHWEAAARARYTRLIVNGDGNAWLFYRCEEAECNYRPSNRVLERVRDGAPREWRGELRPPAGVPLPVRIVQADENTLSVEAYGQTVDFTKKPPPVRQAPPANSLEFLGTFAATNCIRKHAEVRQVSLWRQGDRLFAVAIFQTLVAGRPALFVSPTVMGEGRRNGDGWDFEWRSEGESGSAMIALGPSTVSLMLALPRRDPERGTLKPQTVFQDETVDLAPLSTAEDWKYWFDTVWVGHFMSGKVPACQA